MKFECESYNESPKITIPGNEAIGNLTAICSILVEIEILILQIIILI